ncbi:MAG: hypothetical protein M1825_000961 [Sarcosagium campestre]|nr:MAG: hypothetical protein M1825_000961 [Sarcosagium campestre]
MARVSVPNGLQRITSSPFRGKHISSNLPPSRNSSGSSSTQISEQDLSDLEPSSSFTAPIPNASKAASFDPVARSRARSRELPRSRYQFRSPKYYRGPLHPHQPPRPSDPASRLFVPGPFTSPRLEQTYDSTITHDLLALTYTHYPPGAQPLPSGQRLRSWDDSSPYHKGRPLRSPRGHGSVLPLLARPIGFRSMPRVERVTVHSMVSEASSNSGILHAAGMAVQALTSVRATVCKAKDGEVQWGLQKGQFIAVKADIRGEDMYHFLSSLIDVVMPRLKDWRGVSGSSGDSSGNITFGLTPEAVSLFPEIEVNYDMYPNNMIPGCHVTIHTTATNDKDARLLLNAMGIPFTGKYVD